MGDKIYHIAQFGTYDLKSLGDTMFPTIFSKEMKERFGDQVQVDLFSPVGTKHPYNDLSEVFPIDELKERHEKWNYDALVIGGGEFVHFHEVKYISVDGQSNHYDVGELWEKPQKIATQLGIPVYWNCLGITEDYKNQNEKTRVEASCNALGYISVRDLYSKQRLEKMSGITPVHLVGDMLWLFNKHFSKKMLEEILCQLKDEYSFLSSDYIVLQYGTSYKKEDVVAIFEELGKKHNVEVVMMVINYCHEDLEIVNDVAKHHDRIRVIDKELSPLEIMSVIQGAKFFAGTSLHGNVTAMSYGVSNVCINMYPDFVSKMDGLFTMVDAMDRMVLSIEKLSDVIEEKYALSDEESQSINISIQKIQQELKKHFDQIQLCVEKGFGEKIQVGDVKLNQYMLAKIICLSEGMEDYKVAMLVNEKVSFEPINVNNNQIKIIINTDRIFKVKALTVNLNGEDCKELLMEYDENQLLYNKKLEFTINGQNASGMIQIDLEIEVGDSILIEYYSQLNIKNKNQISALKVELNNTRGHVNYMLEKERQLEHIIEEKNRVIQEKQQCIDEEREKCKAAIDQKVTEIEQKVTEIENYKQTINNKNGHIEQLLQVERDYENLRNSKGVRLLNVWWRFKAFLIPKGSKRHFFARMLKKFIKHPIYMIKKCTPKRIARTIKYMGNENAEMLNNRLDAATINMKSEIERMKLDLLPVNEYITSISDVEAIKLPLFENPEVTIIIPVYNQFHYTYNCLKSIEKFTKEISYEVILADDCSTDMTKDILEKVDNLIVAKTKENMRFLRNCNNAAQYASGKYILFLNNDTQVQENWLSSLLALMQNDDMIGMVGSKLVYPDGSLQEAGGIIWGNGNAWNYGNGQSPNKPEFNYVKEVDYISGASIMIRKNLWNEIGGFDERFAPAYCEDSDLAFEVRKHGYKVVFQPQSVVVHFEGKSNGTDLNTGVKKYQIVNMEKLKKKWADEYKQQSKDESDLFHAKDRTQGKKTILVIDHYVPQFDKDAGSRTMIQYLKMFVSKGYNVKFIGDNYYQDPVYTPYLEQMGIEVLYGKWYFDNHKKWIIDNKDNIDIVFLNRPHISEKYIDFLKEETKIKCVYYGSDLHWLRIMREYELCGDEKKKKEAENWKRREIELMKKMDMNYYPSFVEIDEIHKIDPNIPAKTFDIYVYDKFRNDINRDFATREGIMFVGGFGHPPNKDAVIWFCKEVYPTVAAEQQIPFYIVGSNPPKEINELAGDGIVVKGFVSDEELIRLYDNCKMVVVPLRYGAGVKGKVIEAMYYGTPMLATTIGIEGISGAENIIETADNKIDFANKLMTMYNSDSLLADTVDNYQKYITKNCSIDAVWNHIMDDFEYEEIR